MECPQYRVRLFLSADLSGSTAFKSSDEGRQIGDESLHPSWVREVTYLYSNFSPTLERIFKQVAQAEGLEQELAFPRLWKLIGDEVLFVVRIRDLSHLSCCVNAFIRTLSEYSADVRERSKSLDIKGSGWLAAFPAPNVTVFDIDESGIKSDLREESHETRAEAEPREHDFLGPEIDSGFRISHFAASNAMALSPSLALSLCNAFYHKVFSHPFNYHGRQTVKGVVSGRPYPIVSVDIERNSKAREVRNYERAVISEHEVVPIHLANFLTSYMNHENIDIPIIKARGESIDAAEYPQTYKNYVSKWLATAEGQAKISNLETQAAQFDQAEEDQSIDQSVIDRQIDDWLSLHKKLANIGMLSSETEAERGWRDTADRMRYRGRRDGDNKGRDGDNKD